MHIKNFAAVAVLAVGTTFVASAAFAVPVTTGTLGMAFTYQAENAAGANVGLGSATAIDFVNLNAGAPSSANTGSFIVTQATGSFATAGLVFGNIGTIHDLIFSPFAPIVDFFTIGGINFNLTGIVVNSQTNATLGLTGAGIFEFGTVDQRAGTWSFSAQTDGGDAIGTFTASADAAPSEVPEPATLAVLGMGLLGLGIARRRQTAKA